ncbi:uncharacterized protein F4807DRAFT_415711 [Annulohypoxylon truncatum]|uniref:uncharacterized protein n=1 Tax=Annulohypoxylon truncatum TaxID=327061 RepID=UPI0020074A54|nr:uncharacterized protein F4807DRAFT_415711 [Annulohypoxylon truncatum]KAI1212359.1 hypothetical protein F4807DRAFT_415711 [Annulohypoxylon truncatum]
MDITARLVEVDVMFGRLLMVLGAYIALFDFVSTCHMGAVQVNLRVFRVNVQWYVHPIPLTIILAAGVAFLLEWVVAYLGY